MWGAPIDCHLNFWICCTGDKEGQESRGCTSRRYKIMVLNVDWICWIKARQLGIFYRFSQFDKCSLTKRFPRSGCGLYYTKEKISSRRCRVICDLLWIYKWELNFFVSTETTIPLDIDISLSLLSRQTWGKDRSYIFDSWSAKQSFTASR